jgi:cystathionine beta-lyase family protein involved in aluminum resistance
MERPVISGRVHDLAGRAVADAAERFAQIDKVAQINTEKVLAAFHRHRVSDNCFNGTTGYGYNDKGRDTLDRIYADVMGTPSSLVRAGFRDGRAVRHASLHDLRNRRLS